MSNSENQIIGNRYQLRAKLGEGGMGVVYRAFDRLNQHEVALKRVAASEDQLEPGSDVGGSKSDIRVALAHEFQTLASLHHPHVINVLDYGFDSEEMPYFTMNLLEDSQPITTAAQGKSDHQKVGYLIEMLQALAYLHRREIIHRDLKPDNALVTKDGLVKVLDFGLATLREKKEQDEVAGTIAYMAPEILRGEAPSEATDLYSVGIIAYELFAGRHPFDPSNISKLMQDVLFTPVDAYALDISSDVAAIISRLLSKDPGNRYQDPYEVIALLSNAIDQPVPEETTAIRESFLQAAQFIGRDAELALLRKALAEALEGRGSGWIIGGESGVGKTRLMDELRTRALIEGALVLHGQGVSEGGLSYHLWRDPLRRLILSVELTDLEASVLKQIVPNIGVLLGREVPDAPELEGQAGQQRLLTTIIGTIRKYPQLIVIILEDLHWATESLEVLRQLLPLVPELPLIFVGNYRDDERPDLPDELPGVEVIRLERLTDEGIEQLSMSMLGDAGRQPTVLELLKKETEGNVFFLVEVVRALAEEAGRLGDIGRAALPEHVLTGGVQAVIQRRLNRVPESARSLLNVAAIIGRQFELSLLKALHPNADIDAWLTICSNVAVLDVMDEQWRFAHDKLREGLLATLPDSDRKALHVKVATALQSVYVNELEEYAGTISDHYQQAEELATAAEWYARAGKHAKSTYAMDVGITYYQKALDFWTNKEPVQLENRQRLFETYYGLGTLLQIQGQYREAEEIFERMHKEAKVSSDIKNQALAQYGTAIVQVYQGDFTQAAESAKNVEEIARAGDAQPELAQALHIRGWISFRFGDIDTALDLGAQSLALCEELGKREHMIQALNLLGGAHYTTGDYKQAANHFEKALKLSEELGMREHTMALTSNLGEIANALGDYQTAFERYQEALGISRDIGVRDAEMLYLSNLGGVYVKLNDFDTAEATLQEVIQMADSIRFGQLSETYRFLAEAALAKRDVQRALEAAQRALSLGKEVQSQEFIAAAWRTLGQVAGHLPDPISVNGADQSVAQKFDPPACFAESDRICQETGMEGERARTIRAWAQYELERGEQQRGQQMWQQAQEIFARLGADREVEHMRTIPAPKQA